jgi:hypothetical protein
MLFQLHRLYDNCDDVVRFEAFVAVKIQAKVF